MTLQIPLEPDAKLARLAAQTGRTVDDVAPDLLASSVDQDDWVPTRGREERASARAGRLLHHDDVADRIDRRDPD